MPEGENERHGARLQNPGRFAGLRIFAVALACAASGAALAHAAPELSEPRVGAPGAPTLAPEPSEAVALPRFCPPVFLIPEHAWESHAHRLDAAGYWSYGDGVIGMRAELGRHTRVFAHELGHALGLAHPPEGTWESENDIMGHGVWTARADVHGLVEKAMECWPWLNATPEHVTVKHFPPRPVEQPPASEPPHEAPANAPASGALTIHTHADRVTLEAEGCAAWPPLLFHIWASEPTQGNRWTGRALVTMQLAPLTGHFADLHLPEGATSASITTASGRLTAALDEDRSERLAVACAPTLGGRST